MTKRIASHIKSHRAWLQSTAARLERREVGYIELDLEENSPRASLKVAASLDGLATVYGTRGVVGVIDGAEGSWAEIGRAIDYWGWSLKLCAASFFQSTVHSGSDLTIQVSRAACLICCSEVWSPMAEAILSQAASTNSAISADYWRDRKFEPFVLACCRMKSGAQPDDLPALSQPYQKVLASLRDEGLLRQTLNDVCDYHVKNMVDRGGDWDQEFKYPPFELIACEIMLINEVRRSIAEPAIEVDHPLVRILGRTRPLGASDVTDRMLVRVSAFYDQHFCR